MDLELTWHSFPAKEEALISMLSKKESPSVTIGSVTLCEELVVDASWLTDSSSTLISELFD